MERQRRPQAGHWPSKGTADATKGNAKRRRESVRVGSEGGSTATDYARDSEVREQAKRLIQTGRDSRLRDKA